MTRAWISVVLCGALAAGCGRSSSTKSDGLTMWLVGSEAQARAIQTLSEPFTQRTGVHVRCQAISWGEAHSKYLTAVAAGVEPDIGTMGLTWGVEFGRLGALVDLRQAFSQDVQTIQQQTFPGLWQSIEQDSQLYGIPFDVSVQVLYYRTDLVPAPPHTWQELTTLLEQLQQANRRMMIDWGNLSWIGYAPFLWQAGGSFYNPQGTAPTLNTPEAVQALEFFRDLYTRYGVPRTAIPVEQGLRTGDFPLVLSGNWKIVGLTVSAPDIAGKWSIAALPKGPTGRATAFLGGRTMAIFARPNKHEQAWQFVRYLYEPAVQLQLYEKGVKTQDAYLPPNIQTWDQLPMDPVMKAVLKQQASEGKGPPAAVGWTETTNVLESAIQEVILQGADPTVELHKVNEAMEHSLKSK